MNTETRHETSEPFSAELCPLSFKSEPFYTGLVPLATGGYSTFLEHYTPNSSKDHHSWKDFEHYKAWSSSSGSNEVTFTSDTWDGSGYHYGYMTTKTPFCFYDGYYGSPGLLNADLLNFGDMDGDKDFVLPPANLDALLWQAFMAFIPNIRKDLSLLNSIYELKDVTSVPRSLKQYSSTIKSWVNWLKLAKNAWALKMPLSQLLRSGADMYLQQKFNISPLVSDINAVYRVYSDYERRLNDLMSRAGRPHIGHYTKTLEESIPYLETESPWQAVQATNNTGYWSCPAQLAGGQTSRRQVWTEPSVFHCQLDYSFDYSQFQREHARVLGILDMLGVNLNPTIIWNAIPWSFVIDWVVGISKLLDQMRAGWMDPSVCLRRALWSITRSRRILVRRTFVWHTDSVGGKMPPQYNELPMIIEKSYRRKLYNPLGTAPSLTTSGLSFVEGSLASALMITSRKKHRRKH